MIKINLLPQEDRVKKREFRLPQMSTVYLVVAIVAFFGTIAIVGIVQKHKEKVLNDKIELAKEESRKLAPQLAKIKQITKEREEVDRRLSIITSLDRHRYYRVKLLNDVSYKMPVNCWLTGISELSPNRFDIDGITFSNYTVADMISNLEASQIFSRVDLKVAEKGHIKDREVMKFKLIANTTPQ
jgi:type IV pilus assembly protein PilN